MEKKSDIKGILLVVFIIISLALCSYVLYDKILKKDEQNSCLKTDCECENNEKDEDIEDDYYYYDKKLSTKYINIGDPLSYISFDMKNSTWKMNYNACHGYEIINGTFSIEKNRIIMNSETRGGELKIVSNYNFGQYVGILYAITREHFSLAGCTGSDYFVIDK